MNQIYPVFVPPPHMIEDEMEHSGVVDWCYANLTDANVLVLSLEDVYLLQYKSEILNIVNEEINGMISEGENDWIISREDKLSILTKLQTYKSTGSREAEIYTALLKLLEIAIKTKRNMYFLF